MASTGRQPEVLYPVILYLSGKFIIANYRLKEIMRRSLTVRFQKISYAFIYILVLICLTPVAVAQGKPITIPKPKPKPSAPIKYYLKVNDENSSTEISFLEDGGSKTLSVSTNTGVVPEISDLPSWIFLEDVSKSGINIYCSPNNSSSARNGEFDVKVGKLSVKVKVSQSAKIIITEMKFANRQQDGTLLSEYGENLYASDIYYLGPQITYNGAGETRRKTLNIKVFNPDGSLLTGSSSASGYTYSDDVVFVQGNDHKLPLRGWGNQEKRTFTPGVITFEVYCDGEKLFTGKAVLNKKNGESTFLKVNDMPSLSTSFNSDGGTKIFRVSTDCSTWKINSVPQFCEVTDKSNGSFTLKCNYNKGVSRNGQLIVATDNQQVKIDVSQAAGNGMKINKVWTEYNIYQNGEKGMMIHIEFETSGLKGRTIRPCVFFYHQNGDQLKGYSTGNYSTTDGQATVQESATSSYENSIWKDFKLFMPYSQLPVSTPLKYQVEIIDMTTDKRQRSGFEYFQ